MFYSFDLLLTDTIANQTYDGSIPSLSHLGTEGNRREQLGTLGNKREHLGTEGNTWEQKGTLGNKREQKGTLENRREHLGTEGNCIVLRKLYRLEDNPGFPGLKNLLNHLPGQHL
jgi:hypothetical protein